MQKLEGKVLQFGKNTKIAIELIRDWSYEKFEEKFTEAFAKQYNTVPDFDLRVAYMQIRDELKKMGYEVKKEKAGKLGKHKK